LSVLDSPFSHFFQPENLQRLDSEFTLLAQVGFLKKKKETLGEVMVEGKNKVKLKAIRI